VDAESSAGGEALGAGGADVDRLIRGWERGGGVCVVHGRVPLTLAEGQECFIGPMDVRGRDETSLYVAMKRVEEGGVHTSGARFFVNWIGRECLLREPIRKYWKTVFIGQLRTPKVDLGVLQRRKNTGNDLLNPHERYGPVFK
jgi:hypothetical protein